jgi:tRNA G18 (ribose-2'-O)-methylase SpoU
MMARVERVDDPGDPRLRDFTDLRDVQLRSLREPAEGLFLAEGDATIRRALAAGYELRAVLCTERWLAPLADVLDPLDVPAYVVDRDALAVTTGFPVHRGALASFGRRPVPDPDGLLADASRVVVLEDLSDHTNLGAVFRCAAALGWDAVLLTPRCADPLYRRAVRTSMGAVFDVPWSRIDGPHPIREAGLTLVALTPAAEAAPLADVHPPARLALALGAEGPGLTTLWLDSADVRVRIPMRAGIDSLNVAAAAAVACYALGPREGERP